MTSGHTNVLSSPWIPVVGRVPGEQRSQSSGLSDMLMHAAADEQEEAVHLHRLFFYGAGRGRRLTCLVVSEHCSYHLCAIMSIGQPFHTDAIRVPCEWRPTQMYKWTRPSSPTELGRIGGLDRGQETVVCVPWEEWQPLWPC